MVLRAAITVVLVSVTYGAADPPQHVHYVGHRVITVEGTVYGGFAAAHYDVDEDLVVQPTGLTGGFDARATIRYATSDALADGILLAYETRDEDESRQPDGSVIVAQRAIVTVGDDLTEGRSSPQAFIDTRTERTRYGRDGELIVPASLSPHEEPLPLTSSRSFSETDQGSRGASLEPKKYTRDVAADGSFEEHAEPVQLSIHRLMQKADGSGTAFDQIPGFGMRDVNVEPPEGDASIVTVSVRSQGRTIGYSPVTTATYRIPRWYASTWPGPLARATIRVDATRAASPQCSLGALTVTPIVVTRAWVEVASGIAVVDSTERDLSPNRDIVCRSTTTTTQSFDITTGRLRSTVADRTTVHRTPTARTARRASSISV